LRNRLKGLIIKNIHVAPILAAAYVSRGVAAQFYATLLDQARWKALCESHIQKVLDLFTTFFHGKIFFLNYQHKKENKFGVTMVGTVRFVDPDLC